MFKKFVLIGVMGMLLMTALLICSCDVPGKTKDTGLSADIEKQIRQAFLDELHSKGGSWLNYTINDVWIEKYYGTYNGCVVVMMTGEGIVYSQVTGGENIDGIIIGYPNSNRIKAWKDGKFYSLQEAFDKGFLNKEDIEIIANIQKPKA